MARHESDREDLMAEAASLIERIEFQLPSQEPPALVGVNRLDWLFVYVNQDTMYRFDEQGRLRRAYLDGTLYRTTGQTLAAMVRQRSDQADQPAESLLLRHDLTSEQLSEFRDRQRQHLTELSAGLKTGTILRQHPANRPELADRFWDRLQQVLQAPDFLAPAIVQR